jgi:hypothetical protein
VFALGESGCLFTIIDQPHVTFSGDGSPSYYWDVSYRDRMLSVSHRTPQEPEIVIANLIKAYIPGAKFITLMRDPAEM